MRRRRELGGLPRHRVPRQRFHHRAINLSPDFLRRPPSQRRDLAVVNNRVNSFLDLLLREQRRPRRLVIRRLITNRPRGFTRLTLHQAKLQPVHARRRLIKRHGRCRTVREIQGRLHLNTRNRPNRALQIKKLKRIPALSIDHTYRRCSRRRTTIIRNRRPQ